MVLSPSDIEKNLLEEIIKAGYTSDEAQKILQGYKEMQDKKGISADQMYARLFSKEPVYA